MYPCNYDLPLTGNGFCQFYAPHNVYHPGVDLNKGFGDSDCGNEVFAPAEGTVVFMNKKESTGHGFGIFVILKHSDGTYTRYAHLKSIANPSSIAYHKGDLIGYVGKTGTTYCHLHFEVFEESLAQIQRAHYAPWCFYPMGKNADWIRQHYLNPFEWLKNVPQIPDWAKASVDKAKAKAVILDWSNPYEIVGSEKLEWTLEKAGILDPNKHEGKVTLLRWAVILDKLGKLES